MGRLGGPIADRTRRCGNRGYLATLTAENHPAARGAHAHWRPSWPRTRFRSHNLNRGLGNLQINMTEVLVSITRLSSKQIPVAESALGAIGHDPSRLGIKAVREMKS